MALFIFSLLAIIFGFVGMFNFIIKSKDSDHVSKKLSMRYSRNIFAAVSVIGLIIMLLNIVVIVGPGTACTTEFLGNVSDKILYSGVNIVNPMATVRTFNVKTQEFTQKLQMPAKD